MSEEVKQSETAHSIQNPINNEQAGLLATEA
ncbi:MAG: hypothetical protein K0R24_917 [Gammaproteobacteria bacterium]|jgi:hypothetical protein|nr:hypothetical protein [Gammaproteobacteria bacterium]